MTLAYVTTPLLGIVGTVVIGQLGNAALLGGLAAGAIVFDVVFTSFNFLRSGTTGLTAQAMGRGDILGEKTAFWHAFVIAVASGVGLALLGPLIALGGIAFMGADPGVAEAMSTYIRVRMVGAPLALINYAVLGYVLGRGEGALGLLLQVILNSTNVGLCILFALELHWGVAGVAWASVAGEALAAAVGLSILAIRFATSHRLPRSRLLDRAALTRMFSLNRDIMIRSFLLLAAFALFTRQGAQLGTSTLAANAVLMNFFLVAGYFLDGFANAAEQIAGRAIGAHSREAFDRGVSLTTIWGFALAGLTATVFLVVGSDLIGLVTTEPVIRQEAREDLVWAALTALSGVLAFQMDGVFIGATWSRDMRNMMALSFVIYVGLLFGLGATFGNDGLWAALHLFLILRGASLLAVLPARRRSAFGA
nr:MATE family efflux transporter [Rhodoligotrophos appendicifer]